MREVKEVNLVQGETRHDKTKTHFNIKILNSDTTVLNSIQSPLLEEQIPDTPHETSVQEGGVEGHMEGQAHASEQDLEHGTMVVLGHETGKT